MFGEEGFGGRRENKLLGLLWVCDNEQGSRIWELGFVKFGLDHPIGKFWRICGCQGKMQQDHRKKSSAEMDFFSEYGDANRYKIQEVIGKGSYGVVCSAIDTHTGEKVAIKKIHDIFEHISDAARILREIKLLRLLRHPDIVEIKHIMLPPSRKDFKDIYVVFELMESDLHQVIKANDDLTKEHYQFFLYQLLRALKYIHTANVYHRDLKPKNILANANCKLKICDFGLARVAFSDTPTTIFWTDYVATRWYRAPELCGSFYSKVWLFQFSVDIVKVRQNICIKS
ncbi:Mitogen-activated protein kinase 10 [Glycine max]|nr:Mitogen-activated protein kinase 10 [Glycine max]KAH1197588.1 Mitogen-activated protein kinase 10 [Glycine max]